MYTDPSSSSFYAEAALSGIVQTSRKPALAYLPEAGNTLGSKVALRYKHWGIWHEITWQELAGRVNALVEQLTRWGIGSGVRVAFLGDLTPELLQYLLAVQSLGGIAVRFGDATDADWPVTRLAQANIRLIITSQKAIAGLASTGIEVLWLDGKVDSSPGAQAGLPWLEQALKNIEPEDPAFELHARGQNDALITTTLTHQALHHQGRHMTVDYAMTPSDRLLISPATADRVFIRFIHGLWLVSGLQLHLAESPASAGIDRREIGPSRLIGSPEDYQAIRQDALERMPPPGSAYRRWLDWTLAVGAGDGRHSGAVQTSIAWHLSLKPLREALGLTRIDTALVVGGSLSAIDTAFFMALGMTVQGIDPLYGRSRPEGYFSTADFVPAGLGVKPQPDQN